MQIDKPILGQITQGSIFTAAIAERYISNPIWGLCITARCDIAHENKTNVFSYIPIVKFENWLEVDGARIIADRIHSEVLGSARSLLKRKNHSETVLDSHSPKEVADILFPVKNDKDSLSFHEMAEKLMKIIKIKESSKVNIDELSQIIAFNKKTTEKILKELWGNQLSGYYFLPSIGVTENNSDAGFVILLREVHHIPRSVVSLLAKGASSETLETTRNTLDFSVFDFSYPTGKIASPWMEHIMQQFSMLFSRIGLPDQDESSLQALYEVLRNVK